MSFLCVRISLAVNAAASCIESLLNVGKYFEYIGFDSQIHIKTSVIHLQFWAYGSWDSLFPISTRTQYKRTGH